MNKLYSRQGKEEHLNTDEEVLKAISDCVKLVFRARTKREAGL